MASRIPGASASALFTRPIFRLGGDPTLRIGFRIEVSDVRIRSIASLDRHKPATIPCLFGLKVGCLDRHGAEYVMLTLNIPERGDSTKA